MIRDLSLPLLLLQHDRMSGQLHHFVSPETDRGGREEHELQGEAASALARLRLLRVAEESTGWITKREAKWGKFALFTGVDDKLQVLVQE